MRSRRNDIAGRQFGWLTALEPAPSRNGATVWKFRCKCGTERELFSSNVTRGLVRSCGCYRKIFRKKHGHTTVRTKSRTYAAWLGMKARVRTIYADRGITICDRWSESFPAFLADMGEAPEGGSLDRIDNEGNYEPSNCRWATQAQQMANTRRTHRVTLTGAEICLREACDRLGISYRTAMKQMARGRTAQGVIDSAVDYEVDTK